jgi:hypothetical protein
MYKRVVIYPYAMKCEGSQLLRDVLRDMGIDCIRAFPDGNYVPKATDLIVDWGYSQCPTWSSAAAKVSATVLNNWGKIYNAVDKGISFSLLEHGGVPIPERTTHQKVATDWIVKGVPVVQRTKLCASKGKGASVLRSLEFDKSAKLFIKLIDKQTEYRVHVFGGKIIDIHEKRFIGKDKKKFEILCDTDDWMWCRKGVHLSVSQRKAAVDAVAALGLDFGGVDLVVEKGTNKPFVLEVNSAPWLGTINAKKYAEAIKELMV